MKFDAKQLNEVAALMEQHGLTRVRISEEDGRKVELERTTTVAAPAPVATAAPVAVMEPAGAATPAPAAPAAEAAAPAADDGVTAVTAPMVGVFYAAPAPGAEPFVHVGSHVHEGDTLCVIEAMKLMNEVTAERDGEIVEICVEDGGLVEFGGCIMKIK